MSTDFDIAVLGSGFGGSLMAMIARQLGHSVVLIERGSHPRFAIGESSTPLANLLLEELAKRYDLPEVASLSKWGTWQAKHSDLACGLKRGFTFYHHQLDQPWRENPERNNQLLVAASPHDTIADTHWYRPDFDHFLVRQAQKLGVEYFDEAKLDRAEFGADVATLTGSRHGKPLQFRARFVIDASGPRGFLHGALKLGEEEFSALPPTQSLYSHFRGVRRWDELHRVAGTPPYPVDEAAVHHVFEGGWMWILRFNNGITSAGVAVTDALAEEVHPSQGKASWLRLLDRLPSVREQFSEAEACIPFVHLPRLAFRSKRAAGERWAMLPSAAGFVDPLLSNGFPLTLLGIERLARLMEEESAAGLTKESLCSYERQTLRELDVTADLIGALYANMHDFEMFSALTLLYFAAAMQAETVRRLGRAEGAQSFLLEGEPKFGPALRACLARSRATGTPEGKRAAIAAIYSAIEPINLARLGDASRLNWYPCLAEDLLAAAPKLGVESAEIERLLARCGFANA